MKKLRYSRWKRVQVVNLLVMSLAIPEVAAQETEAEGPVELEEMAEMEELGELEEMVVVGSRHHARSAAESPVPVDMIAQDHFHNQGYSDLHTTLALMIPSYNVNVQPVSGSPSLVRPAYLRGLAGDSTLVLVNSKRRHRASVINIFGAGVTDGSHGPDLASIPAIALKQVEVLRDGASAQYGSDAVAGVLNFVLNDAPSGNILEARWGQYYEGDGATYTIATNIGLPLSKSGFVNLSFEYSKVDPTSRTVQRSNAQGFIDRARELEQKRSSGAPLTPEEEAEIVRGNNTPVPAQRWGVPELEYDFKFFANAGFDLSDRSQFYLFANWAEREMQQGFWYRAPAGGRLFAAVAMLADGSTYDARSLFPGGFTPEFGGVATDRSLASGIRGTIGDGWSYDLSGVVGQHVSEFRIWNTVNPQLIHMKDNIPTSYKPGGYTETDYTLNLDLTRPFHVDAFHSPLNVALGLEYRVEKYEIVAGELNSWFDHSGDPNPPLVNWRKFGIGSDGFPGFNRDFAGGADRGSYAAYLDLETDVAEDVLVGVAARYEDYEDFGNTLNGKLSGRWQWTDSLAVRSSLSTGFRAPTVGQVNLVDVTSAFDEHGNLVNNATLPPAHPASIVLGAEPLTPEKSVNLTLGTVFNVGDIGITIDYYRISMRDRISLTRQADLTLEQRADLVAQGAPGAAAIRTVRYFANDFDTTTQGIDFVADYNTDRFGGNTNLTFTANWNDTSVDNFNPNGIDNKRINQVERNLPKFRFTLIADHERGPWQFLARLRYYDEFLEYQSDWVGWPIDAEARVLVDADVGYTIKRGINFVVGAQNLFDSYPTENPHARGSGAKYPDSSPYGFSGGFYYFKVILSSR